MSHGPSLSSLGLTVKSLWLSILRIHHLEILNRFFFFLSRDTGAWSGAWSPFSLAAALPIASSSISLSWVLGRLLPDPAQVLLHCVVAGELQGKGVCQLSVFLQKRKAELQAPGRAYTHPMNIFAWGSVTLNSKEKTL